MMKRFKPFAFMSKSVVKLCDSAVRSGYLVFLGLTSAKLLLKKKKGKQIVTNLGSDVTEDLAEHSRAVILPLSPQTPPPRDP